METGTVKFFDAREGRKYGFLVTDKGQEIFFHLNDGRFVVGGRHAPEFGGFTQVIAGKTYRLKEPRQGDELVFLRSQGTRGIKASPWTHKDQFDNVLRRIQSRPLYRVMAVTKAAGGDWSKPRVEWEGADLQDVLLRTIWNPRYDTFPFHHSDFSTDKWFEQKVGERWVRIDDPRPRDYYR